MTDGASSKSCNVTVVCRFRPLNALEAKTGSSQPCVLFHDDNKGLEITGESSDSSENHTRAFTFDRTFAPTATQKDVYVSTALPQVKEALAGYNCTIFAYGQTGSGKTHTMMGPSGGDLAVDANLRGHHTSNIRGSLFRSFECGRGYRIHTPSLFYGNLYGAPSRFAASDAC